MEKKPNLKILYAEGHKILREGCKKCMESFGHEVHAFGNGLIAFEYLTQNQDQVDAIVTENRMPVMNGLELIRKAREFGYEGPIVLTSMDDLEEKALNAGAKFVDKCESSKLLDVIRELTEGVAV